MEDETPQTSVSFSLIKIDTSVLGIKINTYLPINVV
jgi:hypothetical protein